MKRRSWIAMFSGLVCLIVIAAVMSVYSRQTKPVSTNEAEQAKEQSSSGEVDDGPLLSTEGWPTIYVNIVSHNEDVISPLYPDYLLDRATYDAERESVAAFAKMIADHGAKYNFQTDWNFLLGLKAFDEGTPSTNGKNLLRYLVEDLGVSIDPHSHEHAGYNYADVAYLISQFGVEPSKVVGGLIAAPSENSKLEYVWRLKNGLKYPSYRWQPEVLWGGGTSSHINEEGLWISGVWRPQDNKHYIVDDPSAPLPTVGHYESNWDGLDKLLALQSSGKLTAGNIYTVSIMNGQYNFTAEYVATFADRLEAYADETADGRIVWATIQETYKDWVSRYHSEPSIFPWSE